MIRVITGDCRDVLATMPAESVHCVVTSPPYFGLRDYGTAKWEGGDPACDHTITRRGHRDEKQSSSAGTSRDSLSGMKYCRACGARRIDAQIGLEPTIEEYVSEMVGVFREVRRVLRSDGTLWLNLGDSYAGPKGNTAMTNGKHDPGRGNAIFGDIGKSQKVPDGLKPKDLCGIPWRVAFALQADGWYLRQDIIWAKPNPMPESITDRCTKAHEYMFLFAKGQWSGRPIKLANLSDDRDHLVRGFDSSSADSWATRFGIGFATAILNSAEIKQHLGGTALETQVWQQSLSASGSISIVDLPPIHRLARYAARFLNADATAKQFLGEIHRVGLILGERNDFLIRGCNTKIALPPSVNANGKAAVAIYDAGKIGEFNFVHGEVIVNAPTTCKYFYDSAAIQEPFVYSGDVRMKTGYAVSTGKSVGSEYGSQVNQGGRNKRSVWDVATAPFAEAHFATFPPALIEPCIKAGTSERGCCAKCGAPWERETERQTLRQCADEAGTRAERPKPAGYPGSTQQRDSTSGLSPSNSHNSSTPTAPQVRTIGWSPSCACDTAIVPCTVLDPFAGAGTTGLVADRLQRDAVLIDLSPAYAAMAEYRIRDDAPLFSVGSVIGVAAGPNALSSFRRVALDKTSG